MTLGSPSAPLRSMNWMILFMKNCKLFCCFFALLFSLPLSVTATANADEAAQIVAVTDRDLYVSGEQIWFTVFYSSAAGSPKMLYVEVFDFNKQAFLQQKIALQQGVAHGLLPLPLEAPSGEYYLRIYPPQQRQAAPEDFYTLPFMVFNPNQALAKFTQREWKSSPFAKAQDQVGLAVKTDKRTYRPGALVTLELGALAGAKATVAVVKKGTVLKETLVPYALPSTGRAMAAGGLSISGIIRDKNTGEGVAGKKCAMSVLKNGEQIHVTETDPQGIFTFAVHDLFATQNLIFSMQEENVADLELLINNDFSSDYSLPKMTFDIDRSFQSLIEEMYINAQLSETYTDSPVKVLASPKKIDSYLSPPNIIRDLSGFIEVPSMEEVLNELVPSLLVKFRKNQPYLSLVDGITKLAYEDPLVLLDNAPVRDIKALLDINPLEIASIEMIDRKYILGDAVLNGIIIIKSKKNNYAGIVWPEDVVFLEYETLQADVRFEATPPASERLPDFRNLLYWHPNLSLDSPQSLQFPTSNHCAEYDILIRGIQANGQVIFTKKTIQITK